jgi:hypothetical protein
MTSAGAAPILTSSLLLGIERLCAPKISARSDRSQRRDGREKEALHSKIITTSTIPHWHFNLWTGLQ